ncbi:hypothetical protein AVEN_274214-1 [Araneus ventricosus]|uniref:Uncharacterized protein n=1 Tax=Araneus ventricosus TaxID=182803 RepID=A0A4Y2SXX3_ARAVE|nr:hypothetical protein AVEN_274214-1 [Araneus ventricosus]
MDCLVVSVANTTVRKGFSTYWTFIRLFSGQLTFLCKSSLPFIARKRSLPSMDLEMTGQMIFLKESFFTTIATKGLLYGMRSTVNKKILFPTEAFFTYWADELPMLRVPLTFKPEGPEATSETRNSHLLASSLSLFSQP